MSLVSRNYAMVPLHGGWAIESRAPQVCVRTTDLKSTPDLRIRLPARSTLEEAVTLANL